MVYKGYEFQVPASWPVYRLDQHPSSCVRYDVHAVYLGTPGADMQCPAGIVGRTQTVSFIPSTTVAAGSGTEITYQRAQPQGAAGVVLQRLAAVDGTLTQNTATHELKVTLSSAKKAKSGATVLGTYGASAAGVKQVLETLRAAPKGAPSTKQSAPVTKTAGSKPPAAQGANPAGPNSRVRTLKKSTLPVAAAKTYTSWHGVPSNWPVQVVQPPPVPPKPAVHPAQGFDTCTAPSLASMNTFRSKYSVVGVYIGGENYGCNAGNLSANWVTAAAAGSWGMLPVYVGPQAPCWGIKGLLIDGSKAAAEGRAEANYAISDARLYGFKAGSPVYYDMEGYHGAASCTNTVLVFLSAWDKQMEAAGYTPGVYSSRDSGIADLEKRVAENKPGFTAPDAIWIAHWESGPPTLDDGTLAWPDKARSKQYAGNVEAVVDGSTYYIDQDYVGGAVAH